MKRACLFLLSFALVAAGAAVAGEEGDIHDLQQRLREQEARIQEQDRKMAAQDEALNDLRAKFGARPTSEEHPEAILSIQKNAKVTIGGLVTTKYQYTQAKIKSTHSLDDHDANPATPDTFEADGRGMVKRATSKTGDLSITDAEVSIQIDVNDYFDAFATLDLQNGMGEDYNIAKVYYVRWKNICESGFGIKFGRDKLVFGDEGVGYLDSYAAGNGDGIGGTVDGFQSAFGGVAFGASPFFGGGDYGPSIIPLHNAYNIDGVTQVTPYWEGLGGKLSFELSFMQNIYEDSPYMETGIDGTMYFRDNGKYRSRNYGVGTMSARAVFKPIEDLKFTLSAANYRSNGTPYSLRGGDVAAYGEDANFSKNNPVFGLAASWRPGFFSRLNLWGQWVHGKDVYFVKGLKSDAVNFGLSLDLKEGLTVFAQGDYLRSKYSQWGYNEIGKAWAFYTGLSYSLPYGVSFEAGWKHEKVTYKQNGASVSKAKADTLYGLVGFEF